MSITKYAGEEFSIVMGLIHGAYILFEVFATASGDKFIKHVSTICTSHQLNLLPSMGVEELLDN
eukprot:7833214-Ditylum_brightwellii.AAC.2